jgi:Hypothetical protein TTHB210
MINHVKLCRSARGALLTVVIGMALSGCGGGNELRNPGGRFFGDSRLLGQGIIQILADVDTSGNPTAIGFRMTQAVLRQLPTAPTELDIDLPPQAANTAFEHIAIRYWPAGHDPAGQFDEAHFDFVPFLITQQERTAITATGADLPIVLKPPATDAIPAGFVQIANNSQFFAEAGFGTRFVSPNPPVPASPFTRSFAAGYYNGLLDFLEFHVAQSFLGATTDIKDAIPLPVTVPKGGYYPTRFNVTYDGAATQFEVLFDQMTLR